MRLFFALSPAISSNPAYRDALVKLAQSRSLEAVFADEAPAGNEKWISKTIASSHFALIDLTSLDEGVQAICREACASDTETVSMRHQTLHGPPAFRVPDSVVQAQLGRAFEFRTPEDLVNFVNRNLGDSHSGEDSKARELATITALKRVMDRKKFQDIRTIAEEANLPLHDTQRTVRRLRSQGLIEKIGTTSDSQYRWSH